MGESENAYLDEEEGIIELEDEDGNVSRFEFVDRAEMDGTVYYALIPEDYDEDGDGNAEFVGEEMLATVDDDSEYERVGEMFLKRFSELAEEVYDEDLEELDGAGEE